MTSQVAGGEAIFEEKCVFFPFFGQKKYKMRKKKNGKMFIYYLFFYVTFLMFGQKSFDFLLFLSNY